jgi:hypothetical protein
MFVPLFTDMEYSAEDLSIVSETLLNIALRFASVVKPSDLEPSKILPLVKSVQQKDPPHTCPLGIQSAAEELEQTLVQLHYELVCVHQELVKIGQETEALSLRAAVCIVRWAVFSLPGFFFCATAADLKRWSPKGLTHPVVPLSSSLHPHSPSVDPI